MAPCLKSSALCRVPDYAACWYVSPDSWAFEPRRRGIVLVHPSGRKARYPRRNVPQLDSSNETGKPLEARNYTTSSCRPNLL
jgi:hypothetical protein